jgi:hypothetical protein
MLVVSNTGKVYDFPHRSTTLEQMRLDLGSDEPIPLLKSNAVIEEVAYMTNRSILSEDAFHLVSLLDLLYLLYNYNIIQGTSNLMPIKNYYDFIYEFDNKFCMTIFNDLPFSRRAMFAEINNMASEYFSNAKEFLYVHEKYYYCYLCNLHTNDMLNIVNAECFDEMKLIYKLLSYILEQKYEDRKCTIYFGKFCILVYGNGNYDFKIFCNKDTIYLRTSNNKVTIFTGVLDVGDIVASVF